MPCLYRLVRLSLFLWFFIWIIGGAALVLAQEPPAASQPTAGVVTPEQKEGVPASKTFWGIIKEGGWVMAPLIAISIWCLSLIIEGFVRIRLIKFAPPDTVRQLKTAFAEENYQQAWRVCKSRSTFLTKILIQGLERIGRGRNACEAALAEYSLKESLMYRTRISYLSTIGVVSPMVGLFGTVTGMIKAFQTIGTGGIGDPSKLAANIGEVLVATAGGLSVAIPAFFLYYFFRNRLQQVVVLAEDVINQLMVDVKYEELQGVAVGEAIEAKLAGTQNMVTPNPVGPVTIPCPQCNVPVEKGSPKCPNCGVELQWTT